jgi:hypothetical protein
MAIDASAVRLRPAARPRTDTAIGTRASTR